eukprot:g51730.t1
MVPLVLGLVLGLVPTLASSHRFTLQGWSRSVHITRLCFCRCLIIHWKTLLTLKKTQLDMGPCIFLFLCLFLQCPCLPYPYPCLFTVAKDPYALSAKPDPARVAAFLVGTKSSGLNTALRNEFDKIDRAR